MTAIPSEFREELEKLEKKHAGNPEGRYFVPLANAYRKAGELSRAVELLRHGLARHPEYVSAHIVLARCLADQGEVQAAVDAFLHVLQLDSQNLVALRTLGELASSQARVDEARSWYSQLLTVDPMNEEARRALEAIASAPPPKLGGEGFHGELAEVGVEGSASAEEFGFGGASSSGSPLETRRGRSDYGEADIGIVDLDGREGDLQQFDGGGAVVTETIAELYTRQGFYDRAGEVYRELIRRRGGDQRLEERLRRVERLAAGEDLGDEEAESARAEAETALQSSDSFEDRESFADDSFAESFAAGFPVVAQVSATSPAAQSGDKTSHSGAPGVAQGADYAAAAATYTRPFEGSIRDHLRSVLAWTPASERPSSKADANTAAFESVGADAAIGGAGSIFDVFDDEPTPAGSPPLQTADSGRQPESGADFSDVDLPWDFTDLETETESEPEFEPFTWPTPSAGTPEEDSPSFDEPAPDSAFGSAGFEDASDSMRPLEMERADTPSASEPPNRAGESPPQESAPAAPFSSAASAYDDEDLFPWEIPDDTLPAAGTQPAGSGRAADRPVEFESVSPVPESEPAGVEESSPRAEFREEQRPQAPEADPAPPARSTGDAAVEEEDDLESFQAWLRSLKR